MKKRQFLKSFKWLHRWFSLIAAVFILFWCLSGIVLNHRKTFSRFEVNRSILAKEYQYVNWNNASLKGSVTIGQDSVLLFGNIGMCLSNDDLSSFADFNNGFPSGIDHRKIFKVFKTESGELLAATLFGLYHFKLDGWVKLKLPIREDKIIGIAQARDSIYVLSRSHVLVSQDDPSGLKFVEIQIPAPIEYDNKIGLFKTLWVIHSGEIYGRIGKLIVDLVAIIFVFLTLTGLLYYFAPGILKRRRRKERSSTKLKILHKFSIKWHSKLGIWISLLLILTALTGMFLRPPLLIAIANSRVAKIKYTTLDNANPWYDRFRDILYDEELDRFLIGTVEGVYISDDHFKTSLKMAAAQPPISVMGINVFEKIGKGDYLVGSFYGLYRWQPDFFYIQDYLTKSTKFSFNPNGPPLGQFMSAGFIKKADGTEYHIDYNLGAIPINSRKNLQKMPELILKESPMSLWNFALEIHTARFFKFLFGDFYILLVPLFGLSVLAILISGIIVWFNRYLRQNRK